MIWRARNAASLRFVTSTPRLSKSSMLFALPPPRTTARTRSHTGAIAGVASPFPRLVRRQQDHWLAIRFANEDAVFRHRQREPPTLGHPLIVPGPTEASHGPARSRTAPCRQRPRPPRVRSLRAFRPTLRMRRHAHEARRSAMGPGASQRPSGAVSAMITTSPVLR